MEGSGQRTLCSDSGVLRLQLNTLSDGTGLCDPHRYGTGQRLNQQLRVNDPGSEASPLEGAVHQAQEPGSFQESGGLRSYSWGQPPLRQG